MAIVGGLWQLFVLTGMHIAVIMPALATFMALGEDKFIFVASNFAMIAVWGAVFGAALRIRNKEEKALTFGYVISAILGGVTEPALFGCIMRFKRMIPCMVIGGAISGLLAGILGVTLGMPGANSNFLVFWATSPRVWATSSTLASALPWPLSSPPCSPSSLASPRPTRPSLTRSNASYRYFLLWGQFSARDTAGIFRRRPFGTWTFLSD